MQITMFTADCTGQAANCNYPNRRVVSTPEEMREAVRFDHVCAEYKGNYRSILLILLRHIRQCFTPKQQVCHQRFPEHERTHLRVGLVME